MTRPVRDWNVDQSMLLPLSVHDFVPADHVAHFIRDTVAEELDLSAVWAAYGGDRGQPPYHPAMMMALLFYAYCQGIYASRRIAAACQQRVDFMAVTSMERPNFRTILSSIETARFGRWTISSRTRCRRAKNSRRMWFDF